MFNFVITIVAFTGCKKEGNNSTPITKSEMLQGKWQIVSYTVGELNQLNSEENGTFQCDNGEIISYTNNYSIEPYYWNFTTGQNWDSQYHITNHSFDMNASNTNCTATYVDYENDASNTGTWAFNDNESQIKLMVNGIEDKWNIASLSNAKMQLTLDGGTSHQMYLEKR
jgi:hypothetical protein